MCQFSNYYHVSELYRVSNQWNAKFRIGTSFRITDLPPSKSVTRGPQTTTLSISEILDPLDGPLSRQASTTWVSRRICPEKSAGYVGAIIRTSSFIVRIPARRKWGGRTIASSELGVARLKLFSWRARVASAGEPSREGREGSVEEREEETRGKRMRSWRGIAACRTTERPARRTVSPWRTTRFSCLEDGLLSNERAIRQTSTARFLHGQDVGYEHDCSTSSRRLATVSARLCSWRKRCLRFSINVSWRLLLLLGMRGLGEDSITARVWSRDELWVYSYFHC